MYKFQGKLYTVNQKDELAAKLREKRNEASVFLNKKKKHFEEVKKAFEEAKDNMIKVKKEMDDILKQISNYDQTLLKIT